jgi:hypothetical protein
MEYVYAGADKLGNYPVNGTAGVHHKVMPVPVGLFDEFGNIR